MTTTQRHEVKDNLAAADEDDFRIVEVREYLGHIYC